jgi:hypothetical protein
MSAISEPAAPQHKSTNKERRDFERPSKVRSRSAGNVFAINGVCMIVQGYMETRYHEGERRRKVTKDWSSKEFLKLREREGCLGA